MTAYTSIEERILKDLTSSSPEVLRTTVFEVAEHNLEVALPAVVNLFTTAPFGVQEAAEVVLRKMRGPKAVEALIPMLTSNSPMRQSLALDILEEIAGDNIPVLMPLLYSHNSRLRLKLIEIIVPYLPTFEEKYQLIVNFLYDESREIRLEVVYFLAGVESDDAIILLFEALHDIDDTVKIAAIEALTHRLILEVIPMFIELFETSSLEVKLKIINALSAFDDEQAHAALFSYANHEIEEVKTHALDIIKKLN